MFTGPLEDRIAIRELNDTYGDGVVRIDADTWGSVWADDAHWNLMGHETNGKEAIVGFWTQAMSGLESVSFTGAMASCEIDGDTATSRVQTQEILNPKDGDTRVVGGLYEDKLERRGGQWLFTSRIFKIVAEYTPPKN
ncbi:nuclear transport factor 2 family protein [Qipengyuania sp. DSG2-2]|uniref:nuclear transport factor 2 family protein n=1 Tax=Qipengyuania sp. DGS2-2 TaxID=3349631 RepID=UPI0036D32331